MKSLQVNAKKQTNKQTKCFSLWMSLSAKVMGNNDKESNAYKYDRVSKTANENLCQYFDLQAQNNTNII